MLTLLVYSFLEKRSYTDGVLILTDHRQSCFQSSFGHNSLCLTIVSHGLKMSEEIRVGHQPHLL